MAFNGLALAHLGRIIISKRPFVRGLTAGAMSPLDETSEKLKTTQTTPAQHLPGSRKDTRWVTT